MLDRDLVREVRYRLSKPSTVARLLGLKVEQGGDSYVLVLCPVHGERNASCSLYRKNGTVRARCRGCGWTGDALDLVAVTQGLDPDREFRAVLAATCELAGMSEEADSVRGGKPPPVARVVMRPPEPEPERDYPPLAEVADLWADARPVTTDAEVVDMLSARKIDSAEVERIDAARALHPQTHRERLPAWAKFRGGASVSRSWLATGHRLVVPVYDPSGQARSLRAWLVTSEANTPKRIPPSGFRASGLVLANAKALRWLRGESSPSSIVVVEGEPDWLVRSITFPTEAIVGIGSGSWNEAFAERVPFGSEVSILTHLDKAGDRYAEAIEKSIRDRARVFRWTITEDEAAA
jgi:hypothetical protein